MLTVRSLNWPADRASLLLLDSSFLTDRVYHVGQTNATFTLHSVPITPPLQKDYGFAADVDNLPTFDQVIVAERDATIVGIAALKFEAWNQRANLWHFYIAPAERGRGLGRRLMNEINQAARTHGMRCLWLETQNINDGAIQFYRRVGFQWCGLDTSLYTASENAPNEIALFFVQYLDPK